MQVISKRRLREFWSQHGHADAKGPLTAWYSLVDNHSTVWANFADLRQSYPKADLVGNCVVFDIGGNKYRLITRVFYDCHKVYVLCVLTHKEYDTGKWKKKYGCFTPQPRKHK